MNRFIALVSVLTLLTACSSGDPQKKQGVEIPENLVFTETQTTPLPEAQKAEVITLLQSESVGDIVELVWPDVNEPASTTQRRQAGRQKLSIAGQGLLAQIERDCTNLKPSMQTENLSEQRITQKTSASISGDNCPVQARLQQDAYIERLGASQGRAVIRVERTATLKSEAAFSLHPHDHLIITGDVQIAAPDVGEQKMLAKMQYRLQGKTTTGESLLLDATVTRLETAKSSDSVRDLQVDLIGDLTYRNRVSKIQLHWIKKDGQNVVQEAFVNGHSVPATSFGNLLTSLEEL